MRAGLPRPGGIGPEQRDGVVGSVVLKNQRQTTAAIAEPRSAPEMVILNAGVVAGLNQLHQFRWFGLLANDDVAGEHVGERGLETKFGVVGAVPSQPLGNGLLGLMRSQMMMGIELALKGQRGANFANIGLVEFVDLSFPALLFLVESQQRGARAGKVVDQADCLENGRFIFVVVLLEPLAEFIDQACPLLFRHFAEGHYLFIGDQSLIVAAENVDTRPVAQPDEQCPPAQQAQASFCRRVCPRLKELNAQFGSHLLAHEPIQGWHHQAHQMMHLALRNVDQAILDEVKSQTPLLD